MDFGDPETRARTTYRDVAHVAFAIGRTYQVSDTVLRDPKTRRTVLTHAALAYVFGDSPVVTIRVAEVHAALDAALHNPA